MCHVLIEMIRSTRGIQTDYYTLFAHVCTMWPLRWPVENT